MTSNSDFTAFCIYLTFQHFSLSPSLCLRFLWTSNRPSASSKHSPKLPMRDRLVLLCKLGHGASGVVYKARTPFYSIFITIIITLMICIVLYSFLSFQIIYIVLISSAVFISWLLSLSSLFFLIITVTIAIPYTCVTGTNIIISLFVYINDYYELCIIVRIAIFIGFIFFIISEFRIFFPFLLL